MGGGHEPAAGMTGRLIRASGVRTSERRLVGWVAALFLVTQTAHGLGANAADTLFFSRFGVERLPTMIVLAGIAVMLTVLGHTVGLTARGERSWLPLVTAASAAWVLAEWAGVSFDSRLMYAVIWVSTQGVILVTFTVMWNAAGAVVTTRQAKRLFPLFATAGVAGGTLGNLSTGPIAALIGTPSLLLVQALLLVVSTGLVVRVLRFASAGAYRASEPSAVIERLRDTFRVVRSSRLLALAAVFAVVTWLLFYVVVFAFSRSVANSFDSEVAMAAFLGVFSSVATAATFIVGFFAAKRLFARVGIVMSLLALPAVYAAGFLVWLGEFNLVTASLVRGLQWVTLNAIAATAFAALFNVLTGSRRAQVVAFMTAVPAQLGAIAGGLLLILSQRLSDASLFSIGLILSATTVVVVLAMRPAYVDSVVAAVRKGMAGLFDVPNTGLAIAPDGEAVRVFERHLSAEAPEERAFALTTLARLPGSQSMGDMTGYLTDSSPKVRAAAFDAICSADPDRFEEHARIALNDESPELRIRGLRYAVDMGWRQPATDALDDPDVRVRAVAAVIEAGDRGRSVASEIARGTHESGKRALLTEILRVGSSNEVDVTDLLDDDDPATRELAVRVAGLETLSPNRLRGALDDRSLRVRRAAAEVLASTHGGRELLIEVLQTGTVNETEAALGALIPFDELDEELAGWALSEANRAAKLARLAAALTGTNDSVVGGYLRRVLASRVERLEQWVLMAMTTRATEDMMPLVRRGVAMTDPETRAQALEALETIGDRRVLEVLMPLIDPPDEGSSGATLESLRELETDIDPWLRTLSMRLLAELIQAELVDVQDKADADDSDLVREIVPTLSPMPIERSDSLGVVDRVLALQKVEMLAELDPEDLEILARAADEEIFEPGESIYTEGAEGDEALIVVDGSAIVTVERDGERRTVNVYGPGETVGELALLRSGPRSADVTAGEDGLHAVVVTKADLISLLEERPTVALGMLATLAQRMVEET